MARKIVRGQGPAKGKKVANKTNSKKAAAEKLIKEIQQTAKDSGEEPAGLDELIKSIQKEVKDNDKKKKEDKKKMSALVKVVTDSGDKKEDKVDSLDVEERVLELLGIEDYETELDYEQYTILIKEYLAQKTMGGKEEKEGDTEALKKALKTSRGKKGKFKPKTKKSKVTASGFKGKKDTTPTPGKPKKVQATKLLPSAGQTSSPDNIKTEIEEDTQQQLLPLSKSLEEIEKNLQKILETNQKKLELEKQAMRDAAKKEETEGFKKTEAQLEDKDVKEKSKKIEKKVKPVSNIFDMIGNFFKNILLGSAIKIVMDIINNPKKYLQALIDFGNFLIDTLNNIIEFVVDSIFAPVNLVIDAINFGINEIEKAINNIANIIPGISSIDIPDIPNIDINVPDIPNIPDVIQKQAGGGEVINVNNLSLFDGGAIDKKTGMKITGMGKDTQLIAAQPGEIMFSKKAVDAYGADNLLAANAMAGGNNKPKFGKIPGFQDGGQVGKVIIGAGHAPTVENAARGIMLGSDGRSVQGTADDGSSGRNTPGNATGVREWEATRHVVNTLKQLVQERGLTDKIGFRDIYSWKGLSGVPRQVESTPGQQYVDLHFDARGFGRAGVLPSRNESATDRSLMNEFGRYSDTFDPSSKGVTAGGGTLLELAAIDDPAIRSLLEEVKRGEQGPASMQMAEKILRGILPSIQGAPVPPQTPQVEMPEGDMSQAPPAPVLPPPPGGAQVARTKVDVNVQPYAPHTQGGSTVVAPVPGQRGPSSAASAAQGRVPGFNAEDSSNFDLIVVKSIYNIVG